MGGGCITWHQEVGVSDEPGHERHHDEYDIQDPCGKTGKTA